MKDVFEAMMPYIERELAQGHAAAFDHAAFRRRVSRRAGARAFRRHLAENGVKPGAGVDVLRDAIALVEDRVAARRFRSRRKTFKKKF
jgi:tRNA-dihydrouridine synthase A